MGWDFLDASKNVTTLQLRKESAGRDDRHVHKTYIARANAHTCDFYTYISLILMKKSDIGQGYPCEFLSPFLIQEEAIHEQGRVSAEP